MVRLLWKRRHLQLPELPCAELPVKSQKQSCYCYVMYRCEIIEFISWAANLQDLTENSLRSLEPRQQTVRSSCAPRPEETKIDCGNVHEMKINPHW